MAKLRINGDSSGYVDLEAPNAASSSTLDLDQVPQKNVTNTFTETQQITNTTNGAYYKINAPTSGDISSGYLVYQGSTVRGGFYTNPTHGMTHISDNYHTFRNNNANRMTIDSNGYVTTPYQPAFIAYNVSTSTLANGSTPIFNSTIINRGNIYNTTNGRFTAPIAGLYSISGHIRVHTTTNSIAYHRLTFKKNNSYVNYSRGRLEGRTSGDYSYIENYVIVELAANDYITIEIETGAGTTLQLSAVEESAFYGYLIG